MGLGKTLQKYFLGDLFASCTEPYCGYSHVYCPEERIEKGIIFTENLGNETCPKCGSKMARTL